ncbi:conserved hypothetical protein, membrane or secreted [Candidatus Magnetobacterium bavaricum]|uniref:Uncharacterized protein n=1 Tax=Candidatus Magnetobacterium bavaricum TaxID=29290 RepID=A0A0F3GS19_9BACT|nr:conserved hypothetical protein, membrane or secreted [Candidatus Magnetobacterium bavaricum]
MTMSYNPFKSAPFNTRRIKSKYLTIKHLSDKRLRGKMAAMFIGVFLMLLLLIIAINVLRQKTSALKRTEENLTQYNALLSEYEQLRDEQGVLRRRVGVGGLLQGIEAIMSSLGLKDKRSNIALEAQRSFMEFREENAELKINGVNLNELVNILYKMEHDSPGLFIRRLNMKKGFADPTRFDVAVGVSYVSEAPAIAR